MKFAIALLLALMATTASAQVSGISTFDDWVTSRERSDEGRLICYAMSAPSESAYGEVVFTSTKDGGFVIVFTQPNWVAKSGGANRVTFQFTESVELIKHPDYLNENSVVLPYILDGIELSLQFFQYDTVSISLNEGETTQISLRGFLSAFTTWSNCRKEIV